MGTRKNPLLIPIEQALRAHLRALPDSDARREYLEAFGDNLRARSFEIESAMWPVDMKSHFAARCQSWCNGEPLRFDGRGPDTSSLGRYDCGEPQTLAGPELDERQRTEVIRLAREVRFSRLQESQTERNDYDEFEFAAGHTRFEVRSWIRGDPDDDGAFEVVLQEMEHGDGITFGWDTHERRLVLERRHRRGLRKSAV